MTSKDLVPSACLSKALLRRHAKQIRQACSHGAYAMDAAETAADHAVSLLSESQNATVALYHPIHTELDCRLLANRLDRAGFTLALPAVTGKNMPLTFKRWAPGDPLQGGPFGIKEPVPDAPVCIPHILIVPLLAFDAQAYRLGYGGGFYDRTIAAIPHVKAFGFAFAGQYVDNLPKEQTDIALHGVVTEEGVFIPHVGERARTQNSNSRQKKTRSGAPPHGRKPEA